MRRRQVSGFIVVSFASGVLFLGTLLLFLYEVFRQPAASRTDFYRGTQAKYSAFQAETAATLTKLPALPQKYKQRQIVLGQKHLSTVAVQNHGLD